MVLSALALIALSQGQTLSLTLTSRPVGEILQAVSKQMGVELTANEEANREIVLVSVDHMPLRGFMDRIVGVTACEWKPTGKGFQLRPSAAARQKEKQELEKDDLELIRKDIAAGLKQIELGDAVPDDQRVSSGTDRVVRRLVSLIDPRDIAAIPSQQRVVWATAHVNKTQEALVSDSAEPVIDAWIAARNKEIQEDQSLAQTQEDGAPATAGGRTAGATKDSQPAPVRPVYKTDVAIVNYGDGSYMVSVAAYDAKGKVLLQCSAPLYDVRIKQQGSDQPEPPKTDASRARIAFSPQSLELLQVLTHSQESTDLPPDVRKELSHPEQYDPLSFASSDALLSLASSKHRQIIAEVPDSIGFPWVVRSGFLDDFLANSLFTIKIDDDGTVLTVKPADPIEARAERLPRQAVRVLIEKGEDQGFVSLDDVADLANLFHGCQPSGLLRYVRMLLPEVAVGDFGYLRLYGSLSNPQRQLLWSKGTLPFRTFNQLQIDRLEDILFRDRVIFDDFHPFDPQAGQVPGSNDDEPGDDYTSEPTELLPDGVPFSGSVSATVGSQPHLKFLDSSGERLPYLCSPATLARQRFLTEHPTQFTPTIFLPANAVIGERRQLSMNLYLAPHAFVQGVLADFSFPKDAPKVQLSHLPRPIGDLVDEQYHKLLKAYDAHHAEGGDAGQEGVAPP